MQKMYRISIEHETLILVNTKTDSEAGRFETKIEALDQLVDMVIENHISIEHGLELFAEILKSEIIFDKVDFTQHPHKVFKSQMNAAVHARVLHKTLEELHNIESIQEPCLRICDNCKDHGNIYIPGGKTGPVQTKAEGFFYIETLFNEGLIHLVDKERLLEEVEKSNIPYHSEDTLSRNN